MDALRDWYKEDGATVYLQGKGLPISPTFLRDMRRKGAGPRFKYFGKHVMYGRADLDSWVIEEALSDRTWTRTRKRQKRRKPTPRRDGPPMATGDLPSE